MDFLNNCDPDDVVEVDLTSEERTLLRRGLSEWDGPTRCTEELAHAMGFDGLAGLREAAPRIAAVIAAGTAITRLDILRALLATEIAFISDSAGSGHDWRSTVGLSDVDTLALIRSLQRKTTRHVRCLLGNGLGTR